MTEKILSVTIAKSKTAALVVLYCNNPAISEAMESFAF